MSDIVERLRGYAAHSRYVPDPYRMAFDAADEIERLRTEVVRCHARLEIDHCYRMGPEPDLELIREEVPLERRAQFPDAVRCREATIALLEEDITRLRAQRDKAVEALRPFAKEAAEWPDETGDRVSIAGVDFLLITVGDLRRARATLAEIEGE